MNPDSRELWLDPLALPFRFEGVYQLLDMKQVR
jgi:hypothetical protein